MRTLPLRISSPCLRSGLVLLLLGVALTGCKSEEAPIKVGPRPVKIETLSGGLGQTKLEFPGTVRGVQEAELAFEVPGLLQELNVKEGQLVERGDILATIDPRDYQAESKSAQARVRASRADYDRSKALYANDAISRADLDVSRRNYEVTVAEADKATKALEDTRLRAPFTGTIAKRYVENFQNVRAKQPVVFLADVTGLEIRFDVPESRIVAVAALSPEEITKATAPVVEVAGVEGQFSGTITEIAARADPVTRTFSVRCAFDPPSETRVLPGMTAKVISSSLKKEGDTADNFLLPSRAVFSSPDKKSQVWIVDPKTQKVSLAVVEMGELKGDSVEVLSGLKVGQQVVVSGARSLKAGQEVRKYVSKAEEKR